VPSLSVRYGRVDFGAEWHGFSGSKSGEGGLYEVLEGLGARVPSGRSLVGSGCAKGDLMGWSQYRRRIEDWPEWMRDCPLCGSDACRWNRCGRCYQGTFRRKVLCAGYRMPSVLLVGDVSDVCGEGVLFVWEVRKVSQAKAA